MYLYTQGIVEYYAPVKYLVSQSSIWIADFNLTLVTAVISGYAIVKTFKEYQFEEKKRQEENKKFSYTLDNLPIPVAAIKADGSITYINDLYTNYFGYAPHEINTVNLWFEKVYPDNERRQMLAKSAMDSIKNGFITQQRLTVEYHDFMTKDGKIKSVAIHHTFLGDTAICTFSDLTKRKKKRRLIIETMMQAEEKEKMRIAQELHDGVGPLLSTAKIYAHSLTLDNTKEKKEELGNKLSDLLNHSIKELRNTINNVSPQILQQYGLVRAIESFVKNIQPITNIKIAIKATPFDIDSPLVELAVYRSLVELINNSIKYASPSVVLVEIEVHEKCLSVKYSDDGIGFDFEEQQTKGFGLSNIKNRIETLGGYFNLETSPGKGVTASIAFELKLITT